MSTYNFSTRYRTRMTGDLGWDNIGALSVSATNLKSGSKDPRWREKVANMLDATLPYYRVMFPSGIKASPISWTWTGIANKHSPAILTTNVEGFWYLGSLVPLITGFANPNSTLAQSQAKLAFLGKIRELDNPFSGGVFLGELRETVGMIRHPLKGILRETRRYHSRASTLAKLFRSKPGKLTNALEKAYLQWTYGVAPLIGDFDNVTTAIQDLFRDRLVTRISASAPTSESVVSERSLVWEESGFAAGMLYNQVVSSLKVRIVGALKAQADGPSVEKFQDKFQVRARDFVPTLYELIPYSFLLDYVSTTGSVLNGYFTSTQNLVYAAQTTRVVYTGNQLIVGLPGITGIPVSFPLAVHHSLLEKKTFNRVVAPLSVGLSDLRITMPSTRQFFNAFVLGMQRVRGVTAP